MQHMQATWLRRVWRKQQRFPPRSAPLSLLQRHAAMSLLRRAAAADSATVLPPLSPQQCTGGTQAQTQTLGLACFIYV